jgi:uncharacterized secreted protein with C-terminal beta-propeller domain
MLKISSLAVSSLLLVLWGCNHSDDKVNIDYSALKQSTVKDASLSQPSNNDFSTYIKNGIRLRLGQQSDPVALATAATAEGDVQNSSFSTTNVHEIGVDEADRLKYDGEYLYQVSLSRFEDDDGGRDNAVRILKSDPDNATAELVSEIPNDSADLQTSDVFLRSESEQLVSIKNTQYYNWFATLVDSDWQWTSGKTQIQLYDVQTPESPSELWKIEIEGNLEGSRRIGNMLYLVTRYVPNISDIDYAASNDDEKRANEVLILNTPISDLLPHFQTNDGAIRSLVNADDCLVAEDTEEVEGYADVITLSAIDLDTQQVTAAICLNANVEGIYSSTSGFYIGGSSFNSWFGSSSFTAIHKFELEGSSLEYKASATLAGHLGWSDPSFRMSEYQNDLRIVTTDFNQSNGSPEHRLSILRDDGSNQLQMLSSLPNDNHPEPIGKPGEDIFSVRFTDNRAYIVTFERVDPLYAIDLSQPELPVIAGALEMPGFSRYLHPLSNDWLLGIGNQVVNGLQQGVKVELYDIRDISNPVIANTFVFGDRGSYTEATFDLRNISLLNVNEQQKRLALTMDIWEDDNSFSFAQWKESGLFLFELNTSDNNDMTLDFSGKMIAESVNPNQNYPLNSGVGRSKLHNDAVFYLHGNQIFASLWGDWEQQNGPY